MTTAQTIIEQLGGNAFCTMTGARQFVDVGNGIKFRIPAAGPSRVNCIQITLDSDDTYTITFYRTFNTGFKVIKCLGMVYADQLQEIFTRYTGLDTHL